VSSTISENSLDN